MVQMNSNIFDFIEISSTPKGLEKEYDRIFTIDALGFLYKLVSEFQIRVTQILRKRKLLKSEFEVSTELPNFPDYENNENWKIDQIPSKLQNRQLDLGDVSPSENNLLKWALSSTVQGIQVDFDDGNCPSWRNQIKGIHNVIAIVNGEFFPNEIKKIEEVPLLIFRPRAWNMIEHNLIMNGKEIPGPLMDFGLLIYHIGKIVFEKGVGPFFYLPKLENASEAKLWNDIFSWAQQELKLPHGSIKACVLIENIFAAFEAEQILYELRHHSFGLNCGIWDYSASIINKLGFREKFVLPDRNKYVNLDQPFLHNYMKLVIFICKKHDAPVTGGMIPFVLKCYSDIEKNKILVNILKAKRKEMKMGVNGFLTYDIDTVPILQGSLFSNKDEDLTVPYNTRDQLKIFNTDLLDIPKANVSKAGLLKNIKVGILFIYSWIAEGKGHFVMDGAVEDSATAEISRAQVHQWIWHQVHLEDEGKEKVTKYLVSQLTWKTYAELINCQDKRIYNSGQLESSCDIFLEVVTSYEPPEFMTTFLYNHSSFRKLQES